MSDNNYAQRMSANNDGMCPDWKPSFDNEKSHFILMMQKIESHFLRYKSLLDENKELDWDKYQIKISINKYNKKDIEEIISFLKIGEK